MSRKLYLKHKCSIVANKDIYTTFKLKTTQTTKNHSFTIYVPRGTYKKIKMENLPTFIGLILMFFFHDQKLLKIKTMYIILLFIIILLSLSFLRTYEDFKKDMKSKQWKKFCEKRDRKIDFECKKEILKTRKKV